MEHLIIFFNFFNAPIKKVLGLLTAVIYKTKVTDCFFLLLALLPTQVFSHPFKDSEGSQVHLKVYHCLYQHSSDLLKALKPIKPISCKLSTVPTGDKILLQCKNTMIIEELMALLKILDKPCEAVKVKLYWIALQSQEAEDLMKIFEIEDLNAKNLWRCLLRSYLQKGIAKTMACPQIHTMIGKPFSFQSEEVTMMVRKKTSKKSFYKEEAAMKLGLSGKLSQLASGHYVLDLDLKHRMQVKDKEDQPKSDQALKTQIKVKKGAIYSVGGIYQLHLYEKKQGNLLTKVFPWSDDLIKTKNCENVFVSALFLEVL